MTDFSWFLATSLWAKPSKIMYFPPRIHLQSSSEISLFLFHSHFELLSLSLMSWFSWLPRIHCLAEYINWLRNRVHRPTPRSRLIFMKEYSTLLPLRRGIPYQSIHPREFYRTFLTRQEALLMDSPEDRCQGSMQNIAGLRERSARCKEYCRTTSLHIQSLIFAGARTIFFESCKA